MVDRSTVLRTLVLTRLEGRLSSTGRDPRDEGTQDTQAPRSTLHFSNSCPQGRGEVQVRFHKLRHLAANRWFQFWPVLAISRYCCFFGVFSLSTQHSFSCSKRSPHPEVVVRVQDLLSKAQRVLPCSKLNAGPGRKEDPSHSQTWIGKGTTRHSRSLKRPRSASTALWRLLRMSPSPFRRVN